MARAKVKAKKKTNKKAILGVDIGHDQLKLALVRGGKVIKTAAAPMPENLLKEGRVVSLESMTELIKNTMKQAGIRAGRAAFVLHNSSVFVKNVEMPLMTVEQLEYNLPFEFNDYITGEARDYVFDYAVLNDPTARPAEGEEGGEPESAGTPTMELIAVGTHRAVLEDAQELLRKAGLKLVMTAPALCAYISLIRANQHDDEDATEEYAILDLGYDTIRMYMYRGDRHVATRELEIGLSNLDNVLADAYGVDVHLAHTYLMSNYENCQEREECHAAYENIAVELMRALNFYRFSNPDSALSDLWISGGGGVNRALRETIGEMLDIQLHPVADLVPGGDQIQDCNAFAQAIGITLG